MRFIQAVLWITVIFTFESSTHADSYSVVNAPPASVSSRHKAQSENQIAVSIATQIFTYYTKIKSGKVDPNSNPPPTLLDFQYPHLNELIGNEARTFPATVQAAKTSSTQNFLNQALNDQDFNSAKSAYEAALKIYPSYATRVLETKIALAMGHYLARQVVVPHDPQDWTQIKMIAIKDFARPVRTPISAPENAVASTEQKKSLPEIQTSIPDTTPKPAEAFATVINH